MQCSLVLCVWGEILWSPAGAAAPSLARQEGDARWQAVILAQTGFNKRILLWLANRSTAMSVASFRRSNVWSEGGGGGGDKKKKKAKVSSDCPLKTESVETHTVCAYRRLQVRLGYSSQEVKIYIQWCGYDITAQRISCLADAAILNCSSHEKKKKRFTVAEFLLLKLTKVKRGGGLFFVFFFFFFRGKRLPKQQWAEWAPSEKQWTFII